jgi:hypothetical protein
MTKVAMSSKRICASPSRSRIACTWRLMRGIRKIDSVARILRERG